MSKSKRTGGNVDASSYPLVTIENGKTRVIKEGTAPAAKPAEKESAPLNIEMADRHLRIAAKWLKAGRITAAEYTRIEAALVARVRRGL